MNFCSRFYEVASSIEFSPDTKIAKKINISSELTLLPSFIFSHGIDIEQELFYLSVPMIEQPPDAGARASALSNEHRLGQLADRMTAHVIYRS
jgi:hypothetical protein